MNKGRPGAPRDEAGRIAYDAGYAKGYARARGMTFFPARFDPILREFTLQCGECSSRGDASYWPLTLEFWNTHSLRRCRRCSERIDREAKRARRAASTATQKERNRAYQRKYRESNRESMRVSRAAYRAANIDAIRARDREYSRRKREAASDD